MKLEELNQNHEDELQELHSMLDKLSEEFNSLKSSQNASPQNELADWASAEVKSKMVHLEFQSIVHQQIAAKIQQTHNKLQSKYDAKMKKYKAEIATLKSQSKQYLQTINENEEKLRHYANITELYRAATDSLKQSEATCKALNNENENMQQKMLELSASIVAEQNDLKSVTNSYEDLLKEINPMQNQHKELKAEYDLVSKAYQEIRDEVCVFLYSFTDS